MLELPESINIADQLNQSIRGKQVAIVHPPTKHHKFCSYHGDPAKYNSTLNGLKFEFAESFGSYVELVFEQNLRLFINDGTNIRYISNISAAQSYQLAIEFHDHRALIFSVSMYGSIFLHRGQIDSRYYWKNRNAISPLDQQFKTHFYDVLSASKPSLSAKAFLATEQRFPGIGNGVCQDILLDARIHPKRKIGSFTQIEKEVLLESIVSVLTRMIKLGGRDTEKNLLGLPGGYQCKLSKNTISTNCAYCGSKVKKDCYLGGTIYFCPNCQKENGEDE